MAVSPEAQIHTNSILVYAAEMFNCSIYVSVFYKDYNTRWLSMMCFLLQSLSWISIENAHKRNCFVCSNVYIYTKYIYFFLNLQWFVKLMQYLPPKATKTSFSIRGSRGIFRYWRHITQRSYQSSERKLCGCALLEFNPFNPWPISCNDI